MDRFNVNIADWEKEDEIQNQYLSEWERERIVKRCKNWPKCFDIIKGKKYPRAYSYDPSENDPKYCQRCLGKEGDLIFR